MNDHVSTRFSLFYTPKTLKLPLYFTDRKCKNLSIVNKCDNDDVIS